MNFVAIYKTIRFLFWMVNINLWMCETNSTFKVSTKCITNFPFLIDLVLHIQSVYWWNKIKQNKFQLNLDESLVLYHYSLPSLVYFSWVRFGLMFITECHYRAQIKIWRGVWHLHSFSWYQKLADFDKDYRKSTFVL